MNNQQFRLSSQLRGHKKEVLGICVCGNDSIATSSNDQTIKFWTINQSNGRDYVLSKVLVGHTRSVMPLAWIAPNEEFPEGRIVSGGMDKLVLVWNLASGKRCQTLKGHQQQVTGITLDGSDIISSSVDCTLRRWRGGKQVEVWKAHNTAIQAVLKLPSGELITGSSDKTVKLWNGKTYSSTVSQHSDTVRSLAVMPGLGFLSASHDCTIKRWNLDGELLSEMVGHTSMVYSVDAHESGLIVSGSEDCFAKIWRDGTCLQSIEHPCCVSDAKFLANVDIVTACSDGVVRVWTVHSDRFADSQEAELYASLLSKYRCSRKIIGGLELNEFADLKALETPGTSDGQTIVVREGENGVAYAWNMIENKWEKQEARMVVGDKTMALTLESPLAVLPPCNGRCETAGTGIVTIAVLTLSACMSVLNLALPVMSEAYDGIVTMLNLFISIPLVCCYVVKVNLERDEDKKSKRSRAKVHSFGVLMVIIICITVIVHFSMRDYDKPQKSFTKWFKYFIALLNIIFLLAVSCVEFKKS